MTSSPKYRSLARVLESDAQFADWTARRRHEVALTQLLRKHLPRPLAERMRVTGYRDGVLELAANAGAIAATLRQRAAELRVALAREGVDVSEIRVRVQVTAIAVTQDRRTLHRWDSRNATPLFELADRLSDGPLKTALAQWSRRSRGR